MFLTTSLLNYFSFGSAINDLFYLHNTLINTLNGNIFVSYLNAHAFADHVTPSFLLIFAPLYKIKETVLWLIMIKGIAYVITPYVFYLIVKKLISDTTWLHCETRKKGVKVSYEFTTHFYRGISL